MTLRAPEPPVSESSERQRFERAWDDFFASVRRARGRAARDLGPGVSLAQYQLLAPLAEGGELPVGEIAAAAGVATPTATRMLDALARASVVEREPSKVDRRVVTVRLTEKGRRQMRAKRKVVAEKRSIVYESLSARERRQAAALLARLAEVIEEL